MKKSKFTEQQIVFALKQAETGVPVAEVCRKIGISEATFFNQTCLPCLFDCPLSCLFQTTGSA
jgi:putative transposase